MNITTNISFVSVVIPLYNGEQYIAETLKSVLEQTYPYLEIVVVDDGSTDNGPEIVHSFTDERIHYIRQKNRGIAGARNTGITEANGAYIAFLDQDDLWHKEKLSREARILEKYSTTGVVYSEVAGINEHGEILNPGGAVFHKRPSGDVRLQMLEGNIIPGTAGVLVRRSCFDKVGLFDEELSGVDDWHMWARLAAVCEFIYCPELHGYVRFHSRNTSNDVEYMGHDGVSALKKLFSDPLVVQGIPPRVLNRLRRKSRASMHAYCGTRKLITREPRTALYDLFSAVRIRPSSIREWILLGFALMGYLPQWVRRRII